MDEIKIELALKIIQQKIISYIKNYKGKDKEEFTRELKKLTYEKEEIYNLNKDIIDKVYNVYLEEIRKGEKDGKI